MRGSKRNDGIKTLRLVLTTTCFLLLASYAVLGVSPVKSQEGEEPPDAVSYADVFQVTLLELGYGEKRLDSPYDTVTYDLRLPPYWDVREGSFLELDFSYEYIALNPSDALGIPLALGEIVVSVDGQTQAQFQLRETALTHSSLRVDLPPSLFRVAGRTHTIEIVLDADYICRVPHRAGATIHPTSFFALVYDPLPLIADLADYPRPFYQRAFEPDRVLFVLPDSPTEKELAGAASVAAKLGDLAPGMIISGTSDTTLLDNTAAGGHALEHLIVVGKPENNRVILNLSEAGVLPISVSERQFYLDSEGPATVTPGDTWNYRLTLANTTRNAISSLTLVDELPLPTNLVSCTPTCDIGEGESRVSWPVDALAAGETRSYTLTLTLGALGSNEEIASLMTDSVVIENSSVLLGLLSEPLNVSTLTTTVSFAPSPRPGRRSSDSGKSRYFFLQGGWPVPENDGILQEIISPWDRTRAILVITGLDDESVYKAGRAMGSESHFPGMQGQVALVQAVRPRSDPPMKSLAADLTFADLGYDDRVLEGASQEINYYVDIPGAWNMSRGSYLDLHFSHSQLIDYRASSLTVLFNSQPVATIALDDETALGEGLKVELPASQTRPGKRNKISIQAELHPLDECTRVETWLLVANTSLLHLEHTERDAHPLDLGFYPHPFDQRSDLGDLLFALPPQPQPEEWGQMLQIAAALGKAVGGSSMKPAVAVGEGRSQTTLSEYHIVVIGRPSRHPLLRQINDQLPQPFLPASDLIEQKLNEVVLRLPPDVSLGYLELIPSPWNPERGLLAITGTSDEGVAWATRALVNRPWDLQGNLALVREAEVRTLDTHKLTRSGLEAAVSTAVPELTPVATLPAPTTAVSPAATPPATQATPQDTAYPVWLISLVVGTAVIVAATFAFAIWQARRKTRTF